MPSRKNNQKQPGGLKNLDFMGSKFSLTFPTPTGNFQTTLGGSITLLMGIVSISTFVVVMSQYFNKTAPVVTTSSKIGPRRREFNLYKTMMFQPLAFSLGLTYISKDWSRYVTVKARIDYMDYSLPNQTIMLRGVKQFDFIPCEDVQDDFVKSYVKQISPLEGFDKIFMCPDFEEKEEEYTYLDDIDNLKYQLISVDVYPCSRPNPADCASEQELNAMIVDVSPMTKLLEPSDFENPVRNFSVRRYHELDIGLKKTVKFDMKNERVVDDASRFSPPIVKTQFSTAYISSTDYKLRDKGQRHCSKAQISNPHFGGCAPYVTYSYTGLGEVGIIRRNYKKWTEMLGEFGGILKCLTTSAFFFYTFYNVWAMKRYLKEKMMGADKQLTKEVGRLLREAVKDEEAGGYQDGKGKGQDTKDWGKSGNSNGDQNKGNKSKSKNSKQTEAEKILKRMLENRFNVEDLIHKLHTIDLIEKVLFDSEEEKRLIPLVLYKVQEEERELKKEQQQESAQEQKKGDQSRPNSKKQLFTKLGQVSPENDFNCPNKGISTKAQLKGMITKTKTQRKVSSIRETYKAMLRGAQISPRDEQRTEAQPQQQQPPKEGSFKSLVRSYMLDRLNPIFNKNHKKVEKRQNLMKNEEKQKNKPEFTFGSSEADREFQKEDQEPVVIIKGEKLQMKMCEIAADPEAAKTNSGSLLVSTMRNSEGSGRFEREDEPISALESPSTLVNRKKPILARAMKNRLGRSNSRKGSFQRMSRFSRQSSKR